MAEKGFGVKEINLIGASGTPTIESPNNLNLNAVNVAISTNVSIGGTLTVTGNISAGGTVTYEDVTNVDSVGIITARQGVRINADSANPAGASATNYLSVGASQDLKLYHNGNQNYISDLEYTSVINKDLPNREIVKNYGIAPYFTEYIRRELEKIDEDSAEISDEQKALGAARLNYVMGLNINSGRLHALVKVIQNDLELDAEIASYLQTANEVPAEDKFDQMLTSIGSNSAITKQREAQANLDPKEKELRSQKVR